jgi:hypothetical protein
METKKTKPIILINEKNKSNIIFTKDKKINVSFKIHMKNMNGQKHK